MRGQILTQRQFNELFSGGIAGMRRLSPYPEDIQKQIDDVVLKVNTKRLVVLEDVMAAGLVVPVDPYSALTFTWTETSRHGRAKVVEDPGGITEDHQREARPESVPLAFLVDYFSLTRRQQGISIKSGQSLQLDGLEEAVLNVNELAEFTFLNGSDFKVGSSTVPGILTHPDRSTISFVGNKEWTDPTHSGEDKLTDLLSHKQKHLDNQQFGRFMFWVPTNYAVELDKPFAVGGEKISVRNRLLQTEGLIDIRVADFLPDSRTLSSVMESTVIRVLDGGRPTSISWVSPNSQKLEHLIVASLTPNPRSNFEKKSGITTGSPAGGI